MGSPTTVDGAIDGDLFVAFCIQVLAPTLTRGNTAVLDNLSAHTVKGVREPIEPAGATRAYITSVP